MNATSQAAAFSASRSDWQRSAIAFVVIPLALATTVLLAARLYQSTLPYQLNYNEGWNAAWAAQAARGEPLYPSPGAAVFNNYPPLSFLLVGALSHLGVAPWIIGRALAWLGFAGCALLIRAILRACGSAGATLAAWLFVAVMVVSFHDYVGMDDPQLLAQCVMLMGLWLLLRQGPPTRRAVIAAAVAMVIGGFIKHNLLALPVATTLWLAMYHRNRLGVWLAAAAGSIGLAFLICSICFGTDFISGLLTPRLWSTDFLWRKLRLWLPPVLPMALVTLAPLAVPGRERLSTALALFAAVALGVGCLSLGGEGVVYNALFELLVAAALGVGFLAGESARRPVLSCLALVVASLVTMSAVVGATAGLTYRQDWLSDQHRQVLAAQRAVARIAAQPGPALCQDLLLCNWAGKPFVVDLFNYAQSVRLGRRDGGELQGLIARQVFGAIQLNRLDGPLPDGLVSAIEYAYAPVADIPGLYLPLPRLTTP